MFRQLEQPADKKPVGKKLSDPLTLALTYMLANPIVLFTIFVPEPNSVWPLHRMIKRALRWSLQATVVETLKNNITSSLNKALLEFVGR